MLTSFVFYGFHPRLRHGGQVIEKFDPLSGVGNLKNRNNQITDLGVVEPLNRPRCNLGKNGNDNEGHNPEWG
jgi:hypothetical protein